MTQQTDRLNTALAGRYRIERHLGEGGMASVYLCEDLKHDRKVALKLLKPELAAVLGADRFVVEIKTTARLQHPHILPLFDSGTADGFLFYVMPFIEGETLREKLNRETQLGVDGAVRIAREVLDALQYAHEHGIVHRDVKPENILLHGGHAIVADFGIALAVSAAAGGRMTETGLSLGTPHYMSPEQATAEKEITARSDVYSLGSVLYEMLTGQPPHVGGSAQQIIMKIITTPAEPVTVHRKSVPPNVAAAVAQSLEKLPADRFESAKAFGEALANPAYRNTIVAVVGPANGGGRSQSFSAPLVALSMLAVAATAAAAAWGWLRSPPAPRSSRFALVVPDSAQPDPDRENTLTLSRDGSLLAWVTAAPTHIYVRPMGEYLPRHVQGADGWNCPTFSPDGSWIAVMQSTTGGRLAKIPVAGGTPIVLADSASCPAAWTDRDEIVYVKGGKEVWRVSAKGGTAAAVVRSDSVNKIARFGVGDALPGGAAVLIASTTSSAQKTELGVLTLADGRIRNLGVPGTSPRFARPAHLLFARAGGTVFAAPFSLRSLSVTGPETAIVQDVHFSNGGLATMRVSDDGTLAYLAGSDAGRRLFRVDRGGSASALSDDSLYFGWPVVSPDGRRVALEIGTGQAGWDVWVQDLASRTLTRLTTGQGIRPGGWDADNRRVVYLSTSRGTTTSQRSVVAQVWDGSAPPEVLLTLPRSIDEVAIGPPHGYLAVTLDLFGGLGGDIWIAPLDSLKSARVFMATAASEHDPRFSPDGKLLAYVSNATGRDEVYVSSVPGPGSRLQVSAGGGANPQWAPGGHEIFYRGERRMMVATLSGTKELIVTRRDSLFDLALAVGRGNLIAGPNGKFGVFPDGKSLLMIGSAPSNARVSVILNWQALLAGQGKK